MRDQREVLKEKRSEVEIVCTILDAVGRGETRKAPLMSGSRLSVRAFGRYLSLIIERGLVSLEDDGSNHDSYRLTEKGRGFLQRYRALEKLLV